MNKRSKITIKKLDGTEEEFLTDKDSGGLSYQRDAEGRLFFYSNGKKILVHLREIFGLTIDEIE